MDVVERANHPVRPAVLLHQPAVCPEPGILSPHSIRSGTAHLEHLGTAAADIIQNGRDIVRMYDLLVKKNL